MNKNNKNNGDVFLLPKEMVSGVKYLIQKKQDKLNLGLFFSKYVLWGKDKKGKLKCSIKKQLEFLLSNSYKKAISTSMIPLNEYENYIQRRKRLFCDLKHMGFSVRYLKDEDKGLPLDWRLVINLGDVSVYETSLLFHRNYSVPYIPATAVKGVTRHWAILKFVQALKNDSKTQEFSYEKTIEKMVRIFDGTDSSNLDLKVDDITLSQAVDIFGTQDKKGKVIFFDAFPVIDKNKSLDLIVLDIMNVHYPDYYRDEKGSTPPGDWMNPNPIFFLAVRGVGFNFAVASKDEDLAEKTRKLLKESLENLGVGAKTSVGYGYFGGGGF